MGTPDQLRERFRRYEDIGIDSMMFVAHGGETRHEPWPEPDPDYQVNLEGRQYSK